MTKRVAVLRPEPGNARTAERAAARGMAVLRLPLFETRPVVWTPPDPARFDALLLTSAAAIRHAGPGLEEVRQLPAVVVGPETRAAATAAGLTIAATGSNGVAAALELARAQGLDRFLHLAGRERMPDAPGVTPIIVYASEPLPLAPGATRVLTEGWTALLHSARAAERLAHLVDGDRTPRAQVGIAALSPMVLAAAGEGWASAGSASRPSDDSLLDLLARAPD